jgi:hypothetical protein
MAPHDVEASRAIVRVAARNSEADMDVSGWGAAVLSVHNSTPFLVLGLPQRLVYPGQDVMQLSGESVAHQADWIIASDRFSSGARPSEAVVMPSTMCKSAVPVRPHVVCAASLQVA